MTDWRGWKITDEQAALILNGDIMARNAFYFDNLARVRCMARRYIWERKFAPNGCEYDFDDCINGFYLDIPLFDFCDGKRISYSVYRSFYYSIYGGWLYVSENNRKLFCPDYWGERLYIVDQPIRFRGRSGDCADNGAPLLDMVISSPSPENEILSGNAVTVETLVTVAGKYLSKQENLLLIDLLNGYSKHWICARLGVKNVSKQYDRMCAKLRANYAEIVAALSFMGVELPRFALQKPIDYEKAIKKVNSRKGAYSAMTAEQKARAVERTRLWREKQRAQRATV